MLIKAAELIEDFRLYPRSQVDTTHVRNIAEAMMAGEKFPSIIIDEQNRIIDGFHRKRATLRVFGDEADIEVEVRQYVNDKERFLDALRYNSRHGKGITGVEQTGAILKAQGFKIDPKFIASALGISQERVKEIVQCKVGNIRQGTTAHGDPVPLKRSMQHFAGKEMTVEQVKVNDMAPGTPQSLLINQLIGFIESGSLQLENEKIVNGLIHLKELLNGLVLEKAV
jgi:hypothetical protein